MGTLLQFLSEHIWIVPIALVGILLIPYIFGPILIKFTHRMQAVPNLCPFNPQQDPPPGEIADFIEEMTEGLEAVGFSVVARVYLNDYIPNTVAIFAILEHRRNQDMAIIVAMYALVGSGTDKAVYTQQKYVEFSTDFVDGLNLSVNNAREISNFAPVPQRRVLYFFDVKDPARLYEVHQCAVHDFGFAAKKPIPTEPELLDMFREDMIEEVTGQLGTGYLYLDSAEEYFLPTWKGAVLMTWKHLWPIRAIRRAAWRREARDLLARWGM